MNVTRKRRNLTVVGKQAAENTQQEHMIHLQMFDEVVARRQIRGCPANRADK